VDNWQFDKVMHTRPTPKRIGDRMGLWCAVILKPNGRARSIHCVILPASAQQPAPGKVGADVSLPNPNLRQSIERKESCADNLTAVALHEERVRVPLRLTPALYKAKCFEPVPFDQSSS